MAQQAGQISPDGKWVWNGAQWVPNFPMTSLAEDRAWARPYESARSRATHVTFALAATVVGTAVLTAFLVVADLAPANPTDSQSIAIGLLALFALAIYLGTYIPAIVFFCIWLHRAVRNMPALGSPDPRWSPAGAVGRCFVPFLNFGHPLYGTIDAWQGSDPSRRWLNVTDRKSIHTPWLVTFWWLLWLVGAYVGNVTSRLTGGVAAALEVVSGAALIAAAVLAIQLVRQLTARQDHKHELIIAGQLA